MSTHKCVSCDNDYYSTKGSIGKDQCIKKLPCADDDYEFIFTNCTNGKRKKQFFWKIPRICNDKDQKSIELPID